MAAIPLKPEYGPTLGQLLAPRWRGASRRVRALALAATAIVLALVIGLALTLENAHYAHGGPVPFSFSYRDLYRTAPAAGEYVRVQRRAHGRLEDSFAVGPLLVPSYTGSLRAELPLYTATYIRELRRRYTDFAFAARASRKWAPARLQHPLHGARRRRTRSGAATSCVLPGQRRSARGSADRDADLARRRPAARLPAEDRHHRRCSNCRSRRSRSARRTLVGGAAVAGRRGSLFARGGCGAGVSTGGRVTTATSRRRLSAGGVGSPSLAGGAGGPARWRFGACVGAGGASRAAVRSGGGSLARPWAARSSRS